MAAWSGLRSTQSSSVVLEMFDGGGYARACVSVCVCVRGGGWGRVRVSETKPENLY